MIDTILFDLDGTLLGMDPDAFTKVYFKALAQKLAPHGYEPKQLVDCVLRGTAAMVKNTGERTNAEVFWQVFRAEFGARTDTDKALFDAFYAQEFDCTRQACNRIEAAGQAVRRLQAAGYKLILATNPVFPRTAQVKRLRWAGLEPNTFMRITSYENSHYCKPNPKYYTEILTETGRDAATCIMVGNDAIEDTAAVAAGIPVFLLTDGLLNREGKDVSGYPQGGFGQLLHFLGLEETLG